MKNKKTRPASLRVASFVRLLPSGGESGVGCPVGWVCEALRAEYAADGLGGSPCWRLSLLAAQNCGAAFIARAMPSAIWSMAPCSFEPIIIRIIMLSSMWSTSRMRVSFSETLCS